MSEILKLFLSLSLSGSLVALVLFALKPFLKDRLSKTWHYYIWIIVIVRLLLPYSPQIAIVGTLFNQAENYLAIQPATQSQDVMPSISTINNTEDVVLDFPAVNDIETVQKQKAIDYWNEIKDYMWLLWIGVAVLLFVRKVTSYHNFVRFIKAGRHDVIDTGILDVYNKACAEWGVRKPLALYTNKMATSPMLVGIIRLFIVLPGLELAEKELHHIFIHELTHYKRLDIFYKWLTQVVVCLHWFNPLIYLVSREINKNCEFSCDEAIIKKLNADGKKQYGNTLISSLELNGNYGDTIVSITLNEDAKLLKERLGAIMKFSKQKKLTTVVSMLLTVLVFCGATITGAYAAPTDPQSNTDQKVALVSNTTSIVLSEKEYTYLTELKAGQTKSGRILFQTNSPNAYLYLEIEDYSEPIGIKVFFGDSDNLVSATLGATFAEGGIPGIFVSRGAGTYSVELSRSEENAFQRVVVYGVSTENFMDYEKIVLPKDKLNDLTVTELNKNGFTQVTGFQQGEKVSSVKLIPIQISVDDAKIQLNAEVKGKSDRTLKIISPKGESIRTYNFNEDGFSGGSKEWLTIGDTKIMVTKVVYPGTWYLQLSTTDDTAEEVSVSAKLIDPNIYTFTGDSDEGLDKNIEPEKTAENKAIVKDIGEAKKLKLYDYYKTYDEVSLDIEKGYLFNMDKTFTEKAMPTVTDANFKFITKHTNYLEIGISTKNLKNEGYNNGRLGLDAHVKFEVISPEGDTVYSFSKQGKEIEDAVNITTEIPIYSGEWRYKVSFGYQSDGINPTNLKITAKYKNISEDDITWLKNDKLNGSSK